MNKIEYKSLVKKNIKKPNKIQNYIISFLSGGMMGFACELIYVLFTKKFNFPSIYVKAYITLSIIFIASFLTCLGKFDNLMCKLRCGLLIPTTGFAHSITSSAIDSKKEGLINGIGCSFFKLAGSVILYSITISFFLVILKVIINA